MKKRFIVEILKEICAEENLKIEIFSYEWLCKITDVQNNISTWVEGYNFNLNSAVNYITLYDKVSTSVVLRNFGVECIEHHLLMKESWRKALEIEKTWEDELLEILSKIGNDVVIKFANGSQGLNVYLCKSQSEIMNIVNLLKDKNSLAISKYYESQFEYRFYILDQEILFAYKKIKGSGWMHNLSQGAKALLIHGDDPGYNNLVDLALRAYKALDLRCAAVDVLETLEGPKIIEVNNGIMMDSFAGTSEEYFKIAKDAHKKMLFAALNK